MDHSARVAFIQGLHLTAGISAVIAIVGAIMAVILLRHALVSTAATQEPDTDTAQATPREYMQQAAECAT